MNRKFKVCHMNSINPPDHVRIFQKECTSLARAGYDVYYITYGDSYVENGVNIVGLGEKPKTRYERFIPFAKKVFRKALELDADIYHIQTPDLLRYALKLKKRGKIVIFDCMEHYIETIKVSPYMPSILAKIVSAIYSSIERYVCNNIDAVVYVTPTQQPLLNTYYARSYMITNYPIIEENVTSLPPKQQNRKLCFAGGIASIWNHEAIISILNDCNATYELAGPTTDTYINKLKSTNGWDRVNYKGCISFTHVEPMLRDSAVGMAILSYHDNVGGTTGSLGINKFYEYMFNGLPVVCTNFDLWREIIETEKCGICVNPYDKNEIKDAVLYLLDNPDIATQMGMNGRRAVLEKYNWTNQEKILLTMYAEMTEGISVLI